MKFNTLPHLSNTGFTIIDIGLFYGGENLEAKICRFRFFLDMAMFFRERRRVKTLQILVEFF